MEEPKKTSFKVAGNFTAGNKDKYIALRSTAKEIIALFPNAIERKDFIISHYK